MSFCRNGKTKTLYNYLKNKLIEDPKNLKRSSIKNPEYLVVTPDNKLAKKAIKFNYVILIGIVALITLFTIIIL